VVGKIPVVEILQIPAVQNPVAAFVGDTLAAQNPAVVVVDTRRPCPAAASFHPAVVAE
jgi:hypothetical protein